MVEEAAVVVGVERKVVEGLQRKEEESLVGWFLERGEGV